MVLASLSKIILPCTEGFFSGLIFLFHWSLLVFMPVLNCFWLLYLCNMFWNQGMSVSQFCSIFSKLFWLYHAPWDSINFRLNFSSSTKNAIKILIWVALNLWTSLGNMEILTTLNLPVYEHRVSFHILVSSLISLSNFCSFQSLYCYWLLKFSLRSLHLLLLCQNFFLWVPVFRLVLSMFIISYWSIFMVGALNTCQIILMSVRHNIGVLCKLRVFWFFV